MLNWFWFTIVQNPEAIPRADLLNHLHRYDSQCLHVTWLHPPITLRECFCLTVTGSKFATINGPVTSGTCSELAWCRTASLCVVQPFAKAVGFFDSVTTRRLGLNSAHYSGTLQTEAKLKPTRLWWNQPAEWINETTCARIWRRFKNNHKYHNIFKG